MYKAKCQCLNITVHVQKGSEREADGTSLLSNPSSSSPFFADKVLDVKLAVGGITKEVNALVHTSHLQDWDIYRCINCGIDAYALHSIKGYDRVLVNEKLESNPEVIKQLSSSEDFSSALKIVLKNEKQELEKEEGNAVLVNRDQLVHSMTNVQEIIKKYLISEEQAMNKRIQEYTAQQKEMFAALKSRAFQDKTSVCRVLSEAEATLMETSIHEAMDETLDTFSTDLKSLNLTEHKQPSAHIPKQTHKLTKKDLNRPVPKFSVGSPVVAGNRSSSVLKQKSHHSHKIHVKNPQHTATDADPLFALDGFNDDCEPFFESEEDDFSSSDNSFQSEETPKLPHNVDALKKSTVYSSSVPINLPTKTKTAHSWEEEEPDEDEIPEPSKIRESMKALARSVQYNTEDMFGELPRPRVFTEPRPKYW